MLCEAGARVVANDSLTELDDTFRIGAAGLDSEEYLCVVSEAGAEYGLQLNWEKVSVCGNRRTAVNQSTLRIQPKPPMTYLGGLLASDGAPYSELNERLGAVEAELKA